MMNLRLPVIFLSFTLWAALGLVMGAPTLFPPRHEGDDTLPTHATLIQRKNGLAAQTLNARTPDLINSCQSGAYSVIPRLSMYLTCF